MATSSDPFVRVLVDGAVVAESRVVEDTTSPVFNESVTFLVPGPAGGPATGGEVLEDGAHIVTVELWDRDEYKDGGTLLSQAELPPVICTNPDANGSCSTEHHGIIIDTALSPPLPHGAPETALPAPAEGTVEGSEGAEEMAEAEGASLEAAVPTAVALGPGLEGGGGGMVVRQRIVCTLLEVGASPDSTDTSQRTALMYALAMGMDRTVRQLLSAAVPANPNARDSNGRTVLEYSFLAPPPNLAHLVINSVQAIDTDATAAARAAERAAGRAHEAARDGTGTLQEQSNVFGGEGGVCAGWTSLSLKRPSQTRPFLQPPSSTVRVGR